MGPREREGGVGKVPGEGDGLAPGPVPGRRGRRGGGGPGSGRARGSACRWTCARAPSTARRDARPDGPGRASGTARRWSARRAVRGTARCRQGGHGDGNRTRGWRRGPSTRSFERERRRPAPASTPDRTGRVGRPCGARDQRRFGGVPRSGGAWERGYTLGPARPDSIRRLSCLPEELMTEILTESFCERCGTRYTFESSAPRKSRIGRVRTVSKGVKNFVMSDESSFSEAMADARSEEELAATAHQLDAFHKTFNFCLTCRQYTCGDCWNPSEGRCLTCAPMAGVAEPEFRPHRRLPRPPRLRPTATTKTHRSSRGRRPTSRRTGWRARSARTRHSRPPRRWRTRSVAARGRRGERCLRGIRGRR